MMNRRDFWRKSVTLAVTISARNLFALFSHRKSKIPAGSYAPDPINHSALSSTTNPANSFTGNDSLRNHGAAIGVPVGCAVVPEWLSLADASTGNSGDPYTQTVLGQAGILVAENAMKWSSLRPSPTEYNFVTADKLFSFAQAAGQLVRGHNLCWHEQLPKWFDTTATKENAKQLLSQHIETVAGRYAGKVHSWDVVNEAIHIPDGRPDDLRKSPWLDLIGPEYIELAFTTAAAADPQAKLTYNDFDIELDTPEQSAKRGQVLMLVRRLHARGVPIHAVGIQSHLQASGAMPGPGLVNFIRDLAKIGLEVYITELDVNTHLLPGDSAEQDRAVAAVYKNYLSLVLPEPNVKAILTWGITDAHTWLNQSKQPWALRADGARQRPLPFDDVYNPAPAFFAMRDALDGARQPLVPNDILKTQPAAPISFAPFAVPGSPAAMPANSAPPVLPPVPAPQR